MANISMDLRHTNYLRQNIVFSYPKMIRVSFSLFLCLSGFCYFTLLFIFIKIVLLSLLFYLFIFMKMFFFFMFRDVPECSGMFRNVPACSGMFHVPGFIDAPFWRPFYFKSFKNAKICRYTLTAKWQRKRSIRFLVKTFVKNINDGEGMR